MRYAFYISDGTALTAEAFGHALLSMFPVTFEHKTLPFIDTEKKAEDVCKTIQKAQEESGEPPLIFHTFVNESLKSKITHWKVSHEDYQALLEESEYAAWMSAFGYCANHFTVSVNQLPGYESLEQVNQKLKDNGFTLNTSGGEIKGSPEVYLEQSSTMADRHDVEFSDKTVSIPSCFYEFAKRYEIEPGKLYTGFVAASADKIFESTNAK
mgnify:CR=1 FL=1